MALIECYECSRSISDRAQSCPNCGAPINPHQPLNIGTIDNPIYTRRDQLEVEKIEFIFRYAPALVITLPSAFSVLETFRSYGLFLAACVSVIAIAGGYPLLRKVFGLGKQTAIEFAIFQAVFTLIVLGGCEKLVLTSP